MRTTRATGARRRAGHGGVGATVAASLTVVTSPVAAWYVIGDRSTVPYGATPDYVVQPPALPETAVPIVGTVSVVLAVGGLATALHLTRRAGFAESLHKVLLALLLPAGVLVAYSVRLLTAGSIGVNFGAILVQVVVLPLAALLALSAVLLTARRLLRDP